jgi:hypothetical protein
LKNELAPAFQGRIGRPIRKHNFTRRGGWP